MPWFFIKIDLRYFLILLFCIIFTNPLLGQWQQTNGPYGGGGNTLVEINSNLIMSSGLSGISKSLDNGVTWYQSNNGLPCNVFLNNLIEENGLLYTTVSGHGIYYSQDLGDNWIPLNNGIETTTFYSLLVSGSNIFAGSANGGIYFSPDNGTTWFNRSNGISNEQFQDIYEFNSDIYIAGRNLYRTENDGVNWNTVNIPNLNPNGIRTMTSHSGVFYAFSEGKAYISDDNLISWNSYTIDNQGASIINSFVHDNKVYATTSLGRYFYTENSGIDWVLIQNDDTNSFVEDLLFYQGQIFMALEDALYVSQDESLWELQDDNILNTSVTTFSNNNMFGFSGTSSNGLFRTIDDGENWTKLTGLPSEINDSATNENFLFVATPNGVYSSENNGDTFDLRLEPLDINHSVQSIGFDGNNLVACINGEGVYKSIDFGNTWNLTETNGLNTDTSYNSIFIDQNLIFLSTADGEIFFSDNFGNSWTDITVPGPFLNVFDLKYVESRLYASTTKGLKISNNLGQTWENFNNDEEPISDIAILSEKIYASTYNGVKIASLTEKVWFPLCAGLGEKYISKLSVNNESIFAGTLGSGVYKKPSIDGPLTAYLNNDVLVLNSLSLCPSSSPVNMFSLAGISPSSSGVWSPGISSVNGVFDPSTDAPGLYTFTFDNQVCGCDNSVNIEIKIEEELNAGNNTTISLCESSEPINLLDFLEGDPDLNGEWVPELSSGSDIFDINLDPSMTYTYLVSNSICGTDSAEITIELIEELNSGTDTSISLCSNDSGIDLFEILDGNPDSGGNWSPELSSGTGFFDPSIDLSGTYTYSVGIGSCQSSSTVEVTNTNPSNAGMDNEISLCAKSTPVDLFDYLDGNPDNDGSWYPELASNTGVFNSLYDNEGVYTYTINTFCGSSSASITVNLIDYYEIEDYEILTTELSNTNKITVNVFQEGNYEYSLDGVTFQENNTFSNLDSGYHTLFISEIDGCGYIEKDVYILNYPKFFTPNGDGFNETWKLRGLTNELYEIKIFDRFGKFIKYLNNNDAYWDGQYNGELMPTSDYWFRLTFDDGRIHTGHFTLKR